MFLSVCHAASLGLAVCIVGGWTDRGTVWGEDSWGPMEHCVRRGGGGPGLSEGRNPPMMRGRKFDTAFARLFRLRWMVYCTRAACLLLTAAALGRVFAPICQSRCATAVPSWLALPGRPTPAARQPAALNSAENYPTVSCVCVKLLHSLPQHRCRCFILLLFRLWSYDLTALYKSVYYYYYYYKNVQIKIKNVKNVKIFFKRL